MLSYRCKCPKCRWSSRYPQDMRDKMVTCPVCNNPFVLEERLIQSELAGEELRGFLKVGLWVLLLSACGYAVYLAFIAACGPFKLDGK